MNSADVTQPNLLSYMDSGSHFMKGIPDWLFISSIVFILLASYFISELLNRADSKKRDYFKFDLLKYKPILYLVKKPYFKFIFQFPVTLIFIFAIYAGIEGHQVINITPIITWTVWWGGLIFLVLFLGKAWCFICPWDYVASLFQFLKLFGVKKEQYCL